jgi:autotransporter passenger strand-loop-strand repeat protein
LLAFNETSSADTVSVNALPNTTALNGVSNLFIGSAQAKALGTVAANDTAIDGFVGIGTGFSGNTLIGGALHEITHAMGRIDGASGLSLFRYTGPGSHDFSSNIPTATSYFSIDGGFTALTSFGVNSDPSDFLNSSPQAPSDPFDETIAGSKLTSIDLAMMDVLGFQVTPTSFTVSAGHTDSGIIVNSGDTEFVKSGGTSVAAYALSGGFEVVSAGGLDRSARLRSGAEQDVFGSAKSVVVKGGTQIVAAGGVASGGTVSNGGGQYANSGGRAVGTTIRGGGFQAVYGGTATGTVVSNGGAQYAAFGGKAVGAIVRSGGFEDVFSAGTSSRTIISKGGFEAVSSGSVARATTINSGGSQTVSAGGVASGGTVNSGGVETVSGRASGGTIKGGLIKVASGGKASGTVTFVSGGTLQLNAGASFTGAIKGYAVPDRIDLRGIAFGAGTTRSFTEAASTTSGTLTVTDGTHTVHLTLLGSYKTNNFTLSTDNHGGTRVTDPPGVAAAPQLSFADIAPARPHSDAPDPSNLPIYLPGTLAINERPHAGQTLLATGARGAGDDLHHPLLPALR